MRKIFNTIIFILALTLAIILSLLLGVNIFQDKSVNTANYIKNFNKETVILVLNNTFNGKISARQKNSNYNLSNSSPLILAHQPSSNLFNGNTTHTKSEFCYNSSADKQKVHPIRAP